MTGVNDLASILTANVASLLVGQSPGALTQALYSSIDDGGVAYTRNAANIAAAINLSCLSAHNSARSPAQDGGILISPSVMVVAAHFGSTIGASYTFVSSANVSHTRTVIAEWSPPNSDIILARLSSPLPAAIVPAAIFPPQLLHKLPAPVLDPSTGSYPRVNSPLIIFTDQNRSLYIAGLKNPVWGASGTDIQEYSSSPLDVTLASWWEHLSAGDSGCGFGAILSGAFVALGVFKSGGNSPSWETSGSSLAVHQAQISNKVAEWNLSETVNVADISGYASANPAAVPTPGADMARTYRVYADGSGDYTTIAAAFNAAESNADVGAVIFEYQGAVGDLTMTNLFPNATSITLQPKSGMGPTPANNSLASVGVVTWVIDSADNYNLIISGQLIGAASIGLTTSYAGSITLRNLRHRVTTNLGTGTKTAFSITSSVGPPTGNLVLNIANFIGGFEVAQTSTNNRYFLLTPNGNNWAINLYDSTIDGQQIKTTASSGIFVVASDTAASTVTLDVRNTAFLGAASVVSVRQITGGSGSIVYAGTCTGNRSTDSNASLGTTSGLSTAAFAGADTFNYALSPSSVCIAAGSATSPVATDILGAQRPRSGASAVDVGAVNLATASSGATPGPRGWLPWLGP